MLQACIYSFRRRIELQTQTAPRTDLWSSFWSISWVLLGMIVGMFWLTLQAKLGMNSPLPKDVNPMVLLKHLQFYNKDETANSKLHLRPLLGTVPSEEEFTGVSHVRTPRRNAT
jgi:hypothetical protein